MLFIISICTTMVGLTWWMCGPIGKSKQIPGHYSFAPLLGLVIMYHCIYNQARNSTAQEVCYCTPSLTAHFIAVFSKERAHSQPFAGAIGWNEILKCDSAACVLTCTRYQSRESHNLPNNLRLANVGVRGNDGRMACTEVGEYFRFTTCATPIHTLVQHWHKKKWRQECFTFDHKL